jgi:hypothetical protein
MCAVLSALIAWIAATFHARAVMQLEILALRHQLARMVKKSSPPATPDA